MVALQKVLEHTLHGGSHFQASLRCPVLLSGNTVLIALNALGVDPWTAPELIM